MCQWPHAARGARWCRPPLHAELGRVAELSREKRGRRQNDEGVVAGHAAAGQGGIEWSHSILPDRVLEYHGTRGMPLAWVGGHAVQPAAATRQNVKIGHGEFALSDPYIMNTNRHNLRRCQNNNVF